MTVLMTQDLPVSRADIEAVSAARHSTSSADGSATDLARITHNGGPRRPKACATSGC